MTDFLTLAKPEEAEAAFYQAFQEANLTLMLRVWDEAPDICCIHPMGEALVGHAQVAAGWRDILASGAGMRIRFEPVHMHVTRGLAVSLGHEHIQVDNEQGARPPILATNVYRETPAGWRLILHHASPAVVHMGNQASKQETDAPHHLH